MICEGDKFCYAYSIGFRQGEAFIGCDAVAGTALFDQIEDGIDLSKATHATITTTTTTTAMVVRLVVVVVWVALLKSIPSSI